MTHESINGGHGMAKCYSPCLLFSTPLVHSFKHCEGGTNDDLVGGESGNRPSDSEHCDRSNPWV